MLPNSLTSHALEIFRTLSLWQWRSFSLLTALFDAVVIRSWYDGDLLVVKVGMRHDGSIRHMTCSKYYGYEVPQSARPTRYS